MKFNKAYSGLINKLPPSLVNEAWTRLISRKRNPMNEEEASTINPIVELFLRHEVNKYQKKLKSQRKSWPLLKNSLYDVNMVNQESQTRDIIALICRCDQTHNRPCFASEKEINHQVKKEVDVLFQRLLEYNEKTFGKFMQEITIEYEERVNKNKKLRYEIEQQKIQLQEAEKCFAYLKSCSTYSSS
nr:14781_t:CDS:1 [Entrophospora candida]CAG8594764.1 14378_t:CDS:1 [Entrophospora candida]